MDPNNRIVNGNGGPIAVEPQPDAARVNPAAAQPANGGAPTTPTLPGGPYGAYQPTQPQQPYSQPTPTFQAARVTEPGQGLRRSNPVLWTVLLLLGLLGVAAVVLSVLAVLVAARIIGNIGTADIGSLQTESRSVQAGAAKAADIQLNMRAGDLTIGGGATDLMNSDFEYNVAGWKPELTYSVNGDNGALLLKQPETGIITGGNSVNRWKLRFNNDVPVTLHASIGAGNTTVQIAGLNLKSAEIQSAAGNATLDLTGARKQDMSIRLINSVGNTVVIVPNDVGVKIELVPGLGQVSSNGLNVNDKTYTNSAYGSGPTINVYVESSVGNVTLQTR